MERAGTLFRAGPPRDVSDSHATCRFLTRETPGRIFEPATGVDPDNRCVALAEPVPQSRRQQELVCLVAAHANCPRYLRGVLVAAGPQAAPTRQPISAAVIASALVLAAALAASFGFLAVRGGFAVPLATLAPAPVVAVASLPAASATITPASLAPTSSSAPAPSSSSTPAPTLAPTPAATATRTPAPTRTPTTTPAATRDRFALLTKCPSQANCWIYVIRAGDNLRSIANYFGVSYDRILQMNPSITDPTTIHAGQQLKIPTPTR